MIGRLSLGPEGPVEFLKLSSTLFGALPLARWLLKGVVGLISLEPAFGAVKDWMAATRP
jgi:hypothetical protein